MAKNISTSLRMVLQKLGDNLRGKRVSREEIVKVSQKMAGESRKDFGRGWGDQVNNQRPKN